MYFSVAVKTEVERANEMFKTCIIFNFNTRFRFPEFYFLLMRVLQKEKKGVLGNSW